jgi:predicted Zn-dependent protease
MRHLTLILILIGLVCNSCMKVPLLGRKQLTLIPEDQVNSMAFSEYKSFLATNHVVTNTTDAAMVTRVGQRLAAAVENFLKNNGYADRVKEFNWEYNLVQNNEANAWCMPGGKIVVYTGILPLTKDENGLAVVLGHEISHAVARHGDERMSDALVQQLGGVALDVALQNQPDQTRQLFDAAYGVGTTVGVMLPFSRQQESEADELGLIFMAMAGYDPHTALDFWQRMQAAQTQSPPVFLSDHPSDQTRIQNIKKWMPKAMSYYKPQ